MNRFKRWVVFRWLYVIPPDELLTLAKDRKFSQQLNDWFQAYADNMINTYFKGTKK